MEIKEDNAHDLKILGMLQITQAIHRRMFTKKSKEEPIKGVLKEIHSIKKLKTASSKQILIRQRNNTIL